MATALAIRLCVTSLLSLPPLSPTYTRSFPRPTPSQRHTWAGPPSPLIVSSQRVCSDSQVVRRLQLPLQYTKDTRPLEEGFDSVKNVGAPSLPFRSSLLFRSWTPPAPFLLPCLNYSSPQYMVRPRPPSSAPCIHFFLSLADLVAILAAGLR